MSSWARNALSFGWAQVLMIIAMIYVSREWSAVGKKQQKPTGESNIFCQETKALIGWQKRISSPTREASGVGEKRQLRKRLRPW
jgi:hypothetical protein